MICGIQVGFCSHRCCSRCCWRRHRRRRHIGWSAPTNVTISFAFHIETICGFGWSPTHKWMPPPNDEVGRGVLVRLQLTNNCKVNDNPINEHRIIIRLRAFSCGTYYSTYYCLTLVPLPLSFSLWSICEQRVLQSHLFSNFESPAHSRMHKLTDNWLWRGFCIVSNIRQFTSAFGVCLLQFTALLALDRNWTLCMRCNWWQWLTKSSFAHSSSLTNVSIHPHAIT